MRILVRLRLLLLVRCRLVRRPIVPRFALVRWFMLRCLRPCIVRLLVVRFSFRVAIRSRLVVLVSMEIVGRVRSLIWVSVMSPPMRLRAVILCVVLLLLLIRVLRRLRVTVLRLVLLRLMRRLLLMRVFTILLILMRRFLRLLFVPVLRRLLIRLSLRRPSLRFILRPLRLIVMLVLRRVMLLLVVVVLRVRSLVLVLSLVRLLLRLLLCTLRLWITLCVRVCLCVAWVSLSPSLSVMSRLCMILSRSLWLIMLFVVLLVRSSAFVVQLMWRVPTECWRLSGLLVSPLFGAPPGLFVDTGWPDTRELVSRSQGSFIARGRGLAPGNEVSATGHEMVSDPRRVLWAVLEG